MTICSLVGLNSIVHGQFLDSLHFLTIDFDLTFSQYEAGNRNFDQVTENFNFGTSLTSPPDDSITWNGIVENTGFNISFYLISSDSTYERHQLFFSLANQTITQKWYEWDALNSISTLEGQFGYFQIGLGYTYALLNKRLFKIRPGAKLSVSIPISGSHSEETDVGNIKYFAPLKTGLSIEFPVLFEIKLIGHSYLKLGPTWGVGFFNFDGYKTSTSLNGGVIGFKFKL